MSQEDLLKHKTIMLVDDDKDILATLTRGLQQSGFKVHGFSDPIAALAHVEAGCKDCELGVSDIRMPRMNGFQLVRKIREVRRDMKIIFMTAFEINKTEFDKIFPSIEIGGIIHKPFLASRLAEMITEVYRDKSNIQPRSDNPSTPVIADSRPDSAKT